MSNMIEILGGDGIEYTFDDLNIKAKRTYESHYYEVWEMPEEEFKKLIAVTEEEWQDNYGWYRYADGSIMGPADTVFMVNKREMFAWDGIKRLYLSDEWKNEDEVEKTAFYHSFTEYERFHMPRKYHKLTEYLLKEHGVSTEKNVCALAVDLAKANKMTLAELFKTYEG